MRYGARYLTIILITGLGIAVQPVQNAGQSRAGGGNQGQSQQPSRRPTLGPPPEGGAGPDAAPPTSTTIDIRKLMRIRTLYVENIDNSLSDKLVEALGKMGRFRLVTRPKDADATLRGSCLESRRLKHVHTEVYISDRNGSSLWQDSIVSPFNPPTLDQAVTASADMVATHLQQTLRAGDRR